VSTAVLQLTVRQWADEPDRRVHLDVPVDVPLGEPLDDFVDVAEEHACQRQLEFDADSDGWRLQLPDGSSPNGECLAELGVSELALYDGLRVEPPFGGEEAGGPSPEADHAADTDDGRPGGAVNASVDDEAGTRFLRRGREPPGRRDEPAAEETAGPGRPRKPAPVYEHDEGASARSAARESTPANRSAPRAPGTPRSRTRGRSSQRVVRGRAEAALPRRMGTVTRTLQALSALSPSYDLQEARDLGVNDPARFMREHRKPTVGATLVRGHRAEAAGARARDRGLSCAPWMKWERYRRESRVLQPDAVESSPCLRSDDATKARGREVGTLKDAELLSLRTATERSDEY
jgi:hypothetical protein